MKRNRFAVLASMIFASIFCLWCALPVASQNEETPYPRMAPLDQYLMDRDAEIALARSSAPEAISREAKVLVLGRHGYETAIEGKNGFVCVVERAWHSPPDSPEFWNPKLRGPVCLNPQASRSILPLIYKRTEMALAGQSKAQMIEWMKTASAKKQLPALESGAMSYMMSKGAYLTDDGGHNVAHLMFYTPPIDGADWGANLPNSPVKLFDKGSFQPFNIFIIPLARWSDGTPAPLPR